MDSSQCGDEDELFSGDEHLPHADVEGDADLELALWNALGEKLGDLAPTALAMALDALEFAVAAMGENRKEFANTYETYN